MPPFSQPTATSRLLDTQQALDRIGDPEALQAMLEMFRQSLAQDVPEITRLLQSGQIPEANQLLHALKGIVPIFCNELLSEEVRQVEFISKPAQSPSLPELLAAYASLRPKLEQLHAEAEAALRTLQGPPA